MGNIIIRRQHTSTDRHHRFRVVRAVYVEAADERRGGDDCVRLILFTFGAIVRRVEACGAGTGLLIAWFGQTKVRAAAIVGATGISGPL